MMLEDCSAEPTQRTVDALAPDWAGIAAALARHRPRSISADVAPDHAAVAVVLRDGRDGPEILFIRRVDDPRDPWSGHMAFPGGRAAPEDTDAVATAVRETREELGLDLDRRGRQLGVLDDLQAMARGMRLPLRITPVVFAVSGPVAFTPDAAEVAATLWVPLSALFAPEVLSSREWERGGMRLTVPCFNYAGACIWGLTYLMVCAFLETSGLGLPAGADRTWTAAARPSRAGRP